ncbi:MAG TPA: hypothetical protein VHG28_12960 [Longimicrobiaceae bacterium]|nr:hypothetical protein [Longimicrobiaceae bacterium]
MKSDPVLTFDWQALAGSGFVASVLLLALVERLRRTFVTRQELNGLGDRLNALQTLYIQARDAADEARDRVTVVETEQKHQWERVAEQVIRPLERINEKLESVSEIQAAQTATLEHIGKWLDRAGEHHPPFKNPRR